MANNKFSNDFVIENSKITELSAQKKRGWGGALDQIPFSVGVGPGHRSRGIPYFCTTGNPSSVFVEPKQSRSATMPRYYHTFEPGTEYSAGNLLNITQAAGYLDPLEGDALLSYAQKKRGSTSLYLSGSDDYLDINRGNWLEPQTINGEFTYTGSMTFWVYQVSTGMRTYFHTSDYSDSGESEIKFYSNSSEGKIHYVVKEAGTTIVDLEFEDTDGMDTGEWNHLAVTAGGNGTKLYLNGELKAESAVRAWFADVTDVDRIRLGVDSVSDNDDYRGYIDEFAIWNIELNPTIVAAIAASSAPDLMTVCTQVEREFQSREGDELWNSAEFPIEYFYD